MLIDASLVLSGAVGEAHGRALARLEGLVGDARGLGSSVADPRARGDAVLALLHGRVLRTYAEEQTRVDVALATGRYNCVSSAVLYMILARAAGLSVAGVRTRDHAFCAVRLDGALIDVETTTVAGFDPGAKREFQDQFGRVTGFTYVAANRDPSRVETDERGLLSLIPQNLASLATQQRRFAEAVAPAPGRVRPRARRRVAAQAHRHHLQHGDLPSRRAIGSRRRWRCSTGPRWLHGGDPRLARLQRDLARNEIATLLRRGEIDAADALADRRLARSEIDDAAWRDLMVSSAQLRAQAAARERGFLEALRLLEGAISRLGSDSRLAESARVYRHNYEVEAHNAMAAAFNAGRYEEARSIVERALELLPDSARLRGDLAAIAGACRNVDGGGMHGNERAAAQGRRVHRRGRPTRCSAQRSRISSRGRTGRGCRSASTRRLAFGTGGMRGIIGGGANRMNPLNVRRITQGLASYVLKAKQGAPASAVIAHDSRRYSDLFAREAALVFAANGIRAYVFSGLRPTPELSFAVRKLGATTGIVVTASHNPPQYNGYKVYWEDGAQVVAPHDAAIVREVEAVGEVRVIDEAEARRRGLLVVADAEVDAPFIEAVKAQVLRPDLVRRLGRDLRVVYTPLHGTGAVPVARHSPGARRRSDDRARTEGARRGVPDRRVPEPRRGVRPGPGPRPRQAHRMRTW